MDFKKTNREKTHYYVYASFTGSILSMVLISFTLLYLVISIIKTISMKNDVYSSISMSNEFKDGDNSFNMTYFDFLPSFKVELLSFSTTDDIRSIYNDPDIDIFEQ